MAATNVNIFIISQGTTAFHERRDRIEKTFKKTSADLFFLVGFCDPSSWWKKQQALYSLIFRGYFSSIEIIWRGHGGVSLMRLDINALK